MKSNLPPKDVVDKVWDFVDQFISPIYHIPDGDERDPPGDHHGTGWFVEKKSIPQLCTCEHVGNYQTIGQLSYAPSGGDAGISVGSAFSLSPHPVDFAIANLSRTWHRISHSGRCIPPTLFDQKHNPVAGEYLYIQGFPGADSRALCGQHNAKGLGAYLHEVEPPPKIFTEKPPFIANYHICMAWNSANATPLSAVAGPLSVPDGLSGSVLWNARYQEAIDQGREWTIADLRVTGIVWGFSSKAGVIAATPIEHLLPFLF